MTRAATVANTLRFLAVDAVQKAKSGHPGLPLGSAAMAYALWDRSLKFNPRDPAWHVQRVEQSNDVETIASALEAADKVLSALRHEFGGHQEKAAALNGGL